MEDIAPKLLEQLQEDFHGRIRKNKHLQELLELVNAGKATYIQAEEAAYEIGTALSQAFGNYLSSAVLPDGRMYFNIAQRVVQPLLEEDHRLIADVARQVQEALNKKAKLGLKAQTVAADEDRIYGIVNKVSNAESFDDVAWVLGDPVVNYSQAVVDSILRENVNFQGKAGLTPKIIRKAEHRCCKWCRNLAGVYDYPMVPDDIYRRHERCRCTVDYDPGTGKVQNVHSKTWRDQEQLEQRKNFAGVDTSQKKRVISAKPKLRENVMAEYFRNATPGKGQITYEEGYNISKHKDEEAAAKWILNTFGGDIKLLTESFVDGVKRPDFEWNGMLWDLKSTTTAKAADSAVRKGLQQIIENPGGIILDYGNNEVSLDAATKVIDTRMVRSNTAKADIIIVQNGQAVKIYRYKK